MGIYLKQWALAVEGSFAMRRVGTDVYTREQAESLARLWAKTWPDAKPLLVVNLKGE